MWHGGITKYHGASGDVFLQWRRGGIWRKYAGIARRKMVAKLKRQHRALRSYSSEIGSSAS